MSEIQKSLQDAGKQMMDVGKQLSARVTAPIVAAGAAVFATADKMDGAFNAIRIGTGATGAAFEALADDLRTVMREIPATADQAANAIANLNTYTGESGPLLQDM